MMLTRTRAMIVATALGSSAVIAVSLLPGCGSSSAKGGIDTTSPDSGTSGGDDASDAVSLLYDVGGETAVLFDPCGPVPRTCDPDLGGICTPASPDAGTAGDAGGIDAASDTTLDAASDSTTLDGASDAALDGASDATTLDGASDATTLDGASDAMALDGASDAMTLDAASDAMTLDGASDASLDGDAAADADDGGGLLACRVVVSTMDRRTACAAAGAAGKGQDCATDADCAPGLACVAGSDPMSPSQCLPYCCTAYASGEVSTASHANDYCALLPIARGMSSSADAGADAPAGDAGDAGGSTARIPVWVPLQPCTLLDDSSCPAGATCTVVRNDGKTTCVPTGTGTDLMPCSEDAPCASGYVCAGSRDARTCRRICRTPADCASGVACNLSPSLPSTFGLCAIPSDAG
jgi:hypothetical protein